MVLVGDVHHLEKRLSDFLGVTRTHSCRSGPKYQCCGLAVCVLLVLKIWWRVKVFAGLCIIVFIICVYIIEAIFCPVSPGTPFRLQWLQHLQLLSCWGSWQLSSAACWVWVSGCFGVKFVRASSGCASFGTRALDHWTIQCLDQQDSSFHVMSSKDLVVLVVFICLHWVLGCLGSWSPFFCFFGDDVIICTSNMAAEFHLRIPFNLCCS